MNCHTKLIEAISRLACELHEYRLERKIEFDWLRSHAGLATKCDLQEMEARLLKAITGQVRLQYSVGLAQPKNKPPGGK